MDEWNNKAVVVRSATTTGTPGSTGVGGRVVTVANTTPIAGTAVGGGQPPTAVVPYETQLRDTMPPCDSAPSPATAALLIRPLASALSASGDSDGRDVSHTYWKPQGGRAIQEIGLLEALHRRTTSNASYLLVESRPPEELARNFSDEHGRCVNLNSDLFKLSKTHHALRKVEHVADSLTMDGRTFKSGMREHLPQLHQDDYYLVRYRDYSAWAVSEYRTRARRDSFLSPKYVEQCFAIRVGQNPGVFIPISEPQFLYGCEVLAHQRLSATPAQIASGAVNIFALNSDQFRSMTTSIAGDAHPLGVSNGGGAPPASASSSFSPNGDRRRGGEGYVPPSPWDWTPVAIEKRINHFLEQQYRSVGRMVVKSVVVGLCLYFFVQFVRRGTGLTDAPPSSSPSVHRRTSSSSAPPRSRSRSSLSGSSNFDEEGGRSAVGTVVRSIFVTGPKEFFDFLLGGV